MPLRDDVVVVTVGDGDGETNLVKTDVLGLLTEALTADVHLNAKPPVSQHILPSLCAYLPQSIQGII